MELVAWQWTPYTIPLMVAAAISVISAFHIWRRRHTPSSRTGVLLLLAAADWIMGYALELASVDLPAKFFWDKLQFIGICIIPTVWLVYTLQYTGRERWLKRRIIALLSIVPLITLLLVFTNEAHGLIWHHVWLDTDGPFSVKHGTYGVGLWAYAVYSYTLVLVGTFLLIQALVGSGHLYRWQASALLLAVFAPWLLNAVADVFGWNPFPYLELTPFALGLTVPVVAWSLYRLRLRDIVPVSRRAIIESMSDVVMVLDAQNRVVQLNPAAQHLIGQAASDVIGQPVEQVWPEWPGGIELPRDGAAIDREVVMGRGNEQRTYDVRISPLLDWRGCLVSQVVVLRDITERKRAQEELRESEEKYKTLVEDAPIGIYYSDFHGTFLYGNKKAEEIVGYKREELIGKSWLKLKLLDPKELGKGIKLLAQNRLGRATGPDEFTLNRKDGSKRIVEIYTKVIPIGGKQVVLGMVEDITEHKRAEEEIRRRNEELATMLETARAVSSTLDLEEVLALIAEQMVKATGVDGCTLSRWDQEADAVVTWIERRREDLGWADEPGTTYPLDDFPATRAVLETGHPVTVRVSDPDADPAEVVYMRKMGTSSLLMLPLVFGDRVVGLVELDQSEYEREFTATEIRLCQALADQAAVVIENARLHAETQRRLKEQIVLREAGTVISSALDLEAVLTRIAEQMGRAIDATSAYISSYDPTTTTASVLAEYISPQACAQEQESDLGADYVEDAEIEWLEMMQAGQHDISHIDSSDLTESERAHMQQYGVKTILYIPLRIRGRLIGYTELWESRRRREFTSEEIALCQGIAQQAAIALENARLYEQAQQEIEERRRAEEQIKASLQEKEVLLREIHHRVKNNLQVISSLLYLQSKDVQSKEALEVFQDSQNRVRSMALVHERLYQSKDLARVDFAEYVRSLATYLLRSYGVSAGAVTLKVDVQDVALGIDTAIPCGLIINELVSNALKHAFPKGREGEIRVELCADNDRRLTLIVGDNGVGFPEDLDFRNTTSLGLQLVNTLVNQLDGTIKLDCSRGAEFKITFSKPK